MVALYGFWHCSQPCSASPYPSGGTSNLKAGRNIFRSSHILLRSDSAGQSQRQTHRAQEAQRYTYAARVLEARLANRNGSQGGPITSGPPYAVSSCRLSARASMLISSSMFYQLLYIHLYRPFLKYTRATSPLPSHVSPRKYCTQAAGAISKLFRLYKRIHGLRQICNIAVYIIHSACTIHLLNLPDKNAKRDIIHGLKHLEEMGECWTCARRTLRVLSQCADKWDIEVPDEAMACFARCRSRWGSMEPSASPASNTVLAAHALMFAQPAAGPTPPAVQTLVQHPRVRQTVPNSFHLPSNGYGSESYNTSSLAVDAFKPSKGLPLPQQSAADAFTRGDPKLRTANQVGQTRQDVWNTTQDSRRTGNNITNANTWPSTIGYSANSMPAQLFTGNNGGERNPINLVEDTQDWWFRDQSSLAMGFENWTDMDWSNFSNDLEANATAGVTSNNRTRTASQQQYPSQPDGADYGGDDGFGSSGNNASGIHSFDSGGGMGAYQQSSRGIAAARADRVSQQQQYSSSSHQSQRQG